MSYASVMVPLDPGPYTPARLSLARSLADRFGAQLIGVAAREVFTTQLYGRGAYINEQIVESASAGLVEELAEVGSNFYRAVAGRQNAQLRSARADPMAFLIDQATTADLIVLSRNHEESVHDWSCQIEPGDLILHLGRPVLIAPPFTATADMTRIVIGWKDTREARRAVWDSLPFLSRAEQVFIVAVGCEAASDVPDKLTNYLAQHGITHTRQLRPAARASVAGEIISVARSEGADLIVAGAYGHSRMREVIFGSVTRDLLEAAPVCCMMSH